MRWARVLFGFTLAASVVANGYLLRARSEANGRTSESKPATKPRLPIRSSTPKPTPTPRSIPESISRLDRLVLEERLATAEAKLEGLLPLHARFELGDSAPEHEARLRPILDLVFGVEPDAEAPYELECKAAICRLHTDRPASEWQDALRFETVGLFREVSYGESMYMHLEDAGYAAGIQYVVKLVMSLATSPALAACKQGSTDRGTIALSLRLDADSRHVSVSATGPLAARNVGECIRKALEHLATATPVPPDVTSLPLDSIPVAVP